MPESGPRCAAVGLGEEVRILAEALGERGVPVRQVEAGGLAGEIAGLDLVFLALADKAEAEGLFRALPRAGPGPVFVDLAEAAPVALAGAEAAGYAAPERIADGALINDYPADGARVPTLLVGGSGAAFEAVRGHLARALHDVLHAGGFGSAHLSAKLISAMFLAMKGAAEEIVEVAERHGIPPGDMLSVLNTSSGESAASRILARQLAEKPAPADGPGAGGNADLFRMIETAMADDLAAVEALAAGHGVIPFFTRRTLERLAVTGRPGGRGQRGS